MINKVYLFESALNDAMTESEQWFPRETGGLLLGYINQGSGVITHIVGPGPNARHGYFSFERDAEFSRCKVREQWEVSQGVTTYIGEWHTHPLGLLRPSLQDNIQMREISLDPDRQCPEPILLLLRGFRILEGPKVYFYKPVGVPNEVPVTISFGY